MRLNLGAGKMILDGWVSVGLDDHHDIKTDLRTLPLADDSVDEAMAIHVFEHFYRWEAVKVLREWRRVLKPGARLILELPELMRCCRNILDERGARQGEWGLFGDPAYEDPLMAHKWCYSESELRVLLLASGFKNLRFMRPEFHGRKSARDIRLEAFK